MSADQLSLCFEMHRGDFVLQVNQEVELTGITAVFGPSGSGKTSLLRAIAGLERPGQGRIRFAGTDWVSTPDKRFVRAHERGVGYVFQEARLFDHLDVRGNLAFAHKRSAGDASSIRFDSVVEATGLQPLLERTPQTLSGGEARRVALARALLSRPKLLLLDEPLSGLDRAARRELLPYLKALPQRFGIPAIFVSHDIEEVTALADRVLVLNGGEVQAYGRLTDVARQMDLAPLMEDARHGSVIEAVVVSHDEALGVAKLQMAGAQLSLPIRHGLDVGEAVRLFVDASDVSIATEAPRGISIRNVLAAEIVDVPVGQGPVLVELSVGGARLRAEITRASAMELGLKAGQQVYALIKTMSFAD
ncbi:molybdenum ABC transporter ATP-binding protein [Henriciella sp. AS95]|uniref:molybdenum ABC transporter ATP-binding protein n=1 Tax=Henriciella sp. AS95 TaxID=3135782 RepID=UPI003173B317